MSVQTHKVAIIYSAICYIKKFYCIAPSAASVIVFEIQKKILEILKNV